MDGRRASDVLPSLVAVAITFIVLDTIFIVLRFISRTLIQKASVGLDDLLIVPAYAMNVGLCAIAIVMAHLESIGNPPATAVLNDSAHFYDVIQPGVKCIYALLPLLYLGSMFPKLSLLSLYLRIFMDRSVRIWTFIAMGFVTACGLTFTLGGLFACQPVQFFWNRLLSGHCMNLNTFYRVNTPINIIVDVAILIIPMPALWKLQAPKKKKIGLTVVFMMGGLGMLACIARWAVLLKYTAEVLVPLNTAIIVGWCIIEPAVYLIAACLPPCSSIIMLLAGNRRLRDTFNKSSKGTTMASPPTRNSGFRLSAKPTGGFAHLNDSEEVIRNDSAQTSPTKDSTFGADEDGSQSDVALRDLPGVEIRTDIYVTKSERQSTRQEEVPLSEMLRTGGHSLQ